jgi:tRNA U34 2-thiouridine synthase MnmA/TrmU
MHWITENPFENPESERCMPSTDSNESAETDCIRIAFKTRHSPEFTEGTLCRYPDGGYTVTADKDIQGIAPGQYAIIYTPDRRICLGSGMISIPQGRKNRKRHGES